MDKGKDPTTHPDLERWRKVFNALVQIIQTQQAQLESTVQDRRIVEDRLRMQYEKWVSDVRLLEDQIDEMKRDFLTQGLIGAVEATKANMVLGLKQRECLMYEGKLDNAIDELSDFRVWFDYLSHKGSNAKDKSLGTGRKKKQIFGQGEDGSLKFSESPVGKVCSSNRLEEELDRMKQENQKLSLEKNEKISALQSEVDFVWNQYKTMESCFSNKLSCKTADLKYAMERVESLLSSMEQLECLSSEKDEAIATLKAETKAKDEKITKVSEELELLKKSLRPATPSLQSCTTRSKNSTLGRKNSGLDPRNVHMKKHGGSVPKNEVDFRKGSRSTKRKGDSILSGTPKLFSGTFTFPKLRRRNVV